jgi:hypothetical protein
MEISKSIFWETDLNNINWDTNPVYIIHKVLMYGTINDWQIIMQKYGKERIKDEVLQMKDIDPKSLSFLSCIFNIPKEKFRCYTQILSSPKHWIY